MIANHERPGGLFYLLWVLLTLLSNPISFFLVYVILRIVVLFVGEVIYVGGVRHITEDYLGSFVFFPVEGLVIGTVQYALLRRYLPRMGWWVALTAGGWLLGIALVTVVVMMPGWFQWGSSFATFDLALVALGAGVGVGQWLLLRRRLPRAGWWIAANIAGWTLLALFTVGYSVGMLGLWTLGVVPACATALVLKLLMDRGQAAEPPLSSTPTVTA